MNLRNNLPTPNEDGVYFTVTTSVIDDNRKLGRAIRDKDGYYTDVPAAVLGTVTRNRTQYDTPAFLDKLTNPDSSFNKRITEGTLHGEWGHPFVNLESKEGLNRLLHLEPLLESNHIRSVSVKHIQDLNLDMVMMDTKPTGPYGRYFEEAMEDPTRNVAFSLRGISEARFDRAANVTYRKLLTLVTFDSGVASGGFKETSKRYMASTEDLSFESNEIFNRVIDDDDIMVFRNVAIESFSDSEINDIIKAKKVVIGNIQVGIVDRRSKTIIEHETGNKRGLFRTMMQVKR